MGRVKEEIARIKREKGILEMEEPSGGGELI